MVAGLNTEGLFGTSHAWNGPSLRQKPLLLGELNSFGADKAMPRNLAVPRMDAFSPSRGCLPARERFGLRMLKAAYAG